MPCERGPESPPSEILARYSVRQNEEFRQIRFARSATKHRVPRRCSKRIIETGTVFIQRAPREAAAPLAVRLVFLGEDEGQLLEVIGVREAGGLLVIHAMPRRARYQTIYEETIG